MGGCFLRTVNPLVGRMMGWNGKMGMCLSWGIVGSLLEGIFLGRWGRGITFLREVATGVEMRGRRGFVGWMGWGLGRVIG